MLDEEALDGAVTAAALLDTIIALTVQTCRPAARTGWEYADALRLVGEFERRVCSHVAI